MAGRNFLFVPGPTNVPDRILRSMLVPMEDHRSPRFPELTRSLFPDLLRLALGTGRTHQIRVHLAHVGFPIAGDDKYGDFALNRELARQGLKRMFLHARELAFDHPLTGARIGLAENAGGALGAGPAACTVTIRGLFAPIQPMRSISSNAFHIPMSPVPPPVG